MNRAIRVVGSALAIGLVATAVAGQEGQPPERAQPDPAEQIVTEMRGAEQALKSIALELQTEGRFGDGIAFRTSGTLHVLRGEQPRLRSSVRFEFAEGLHSQLETARSEEGITIYSASPALGEVFVLVSPKVVTDLEWAGVILDRSDLPGMQDPRAEAPLGSAMVDDLRRQFDLTVQAEKKRGEDTGTWLAGSRKPGLEDVAPELPMADRVELFVRAADHALLEVVHHQGENVLQRITVSTLTVDGEIAPEVFAIDGNGLTRRSVVTHQPLWVQIENTIARAEAKLQPADWDGKTELPPECLRPSRRPQ